jgi:hypothetical protein
MLKTYFLSLLLLFISLSSLPQCLTSLPPPACLGTEPLVTDNEVLNGGTTKWYYGAATTINTLTLNGGTLVVCGDLTVDKFYMDKGTIFIRQGARFVIGSGLGSGLQFKGDCSIYNYGTCEVQRNLSLENNATAATPNRVINALSSSVFKMSNQYFVINNNYSWFVNNGTAEFWGIITDAQASPGSVCLGNGSKTKMAILINKVANSYVSPSGNSCVYVFQMSEFYGKLTSSPTLFACLSNTHTSSTSCIPFGCTPNNWGNAQIFSNCAGCAAIAALSLQFTSFTASKDMGGTHKLEWQLSNEIDGGVFVVYRSGEGENYEVIDSMPVKQASGSFFNAVDKNPLQGNNYYMIRYINSRTGMTINSKMAKVFSETTAGFSLYPVPFDNKFYVGFIPGTHPEKIILTDVNGRNIRIRSIVREEAKLVEVVVLDKIQPGIYIIHMQADNKNIVAKTIFKR